MPNPTDLYRACITDVHESQAIFRCLLAALSRPGEIVHLPDTIPSRITPCLSPLMALVSHDTPFSVVGSGADEVSDAMTRATFGRCTPPDEAAFVAVMEGAVIDPHTLRQGTDLRPDVACQVAVAVDGILNTNEGDDSFLFVAGPGVPGTRRVVIDAEASELDRLAGFLAQRIEQPPRGFDAWLIDKRGAVVGIPRTSRLRIAARRTNFSQGA